MSYFQIWNVQTKEYAPHAGSSFALVGYCKEEMQSTADHLTAETGAKHLVHDMAWETRESMRLERGEYKSPVWARREFWLNRSYEIRRHFTHVSVKNPELVAYTVDAAKGMLDVQTAIKPGAYLQRFFADVLSAAEIKNLANLHTMAALGESEPVEVNFATDSADIVKVYRHGPSSCMDGNRARWTRVYGAGDLSIAYLGPIDAATARVLCWQEQKIYGRVYPTTDSCFGTEETRANARALIQELEHLGFKKAERGEFNGARLLKIENDYGQYVMPYLDSGYSVIDGGKVWKMSEFGDYDCQGTEGTFVEDENCNDWTCDHCDDGQDEDATCHTVYITARRSQTWCEYCSDNHAFYCEQTGSYVTDERAQEVDGRTVADWIEVNYCEHDDEHTTDDVESVIVNVEGDEHTWRRCYIADETFLCTVTNERYVLKLASPETLVSIKRDTGTQYESHIRFEGVFIGIDAGQENYLSSDPNQHRMILPRVA